MTKLRLRFYLIVLDFIMSWYDYHKLAPYDENNPLSIKVKITKLSVEIEDKLDEVY